MMGDRFDREPSRREELDLVAQQRVFDFGESQERTAQIFGRKLAVSSTEPVGWASWKNVDPGASSERLGGVVFNANGQVLLVEPTDHFGGYAWTFPKTAPAKGESHEQTAVRAVAEKAGVVPSIVNSLMGEVLGTGSGTESSFYVMLGSQRAGNQPHSKYVKRAAWVTPDQAARLIGKSTNTLGRERDLAVLHSAICNLTFWLSIDSIPRDRTSADYQDPHWMDWFRLERKWGMDDGRPVTRARLNAVNEAANRGLQVELTKLGRPLRPKALPPPTRIWSRQDMAQLRQGMVDDRGLCVVEDRRLFLYRSMSGLCMFEAEFVTSPFGWVIDRLVVDESIYPNGPGTDSWESIMFEHVIANLLLKKLDEALWRRFFEEDRGSPGG